jgi:hypothetical protein
MGGDMNDAEADDWWSGQSRVARSGTVCAVLFVAVMVMCAAVMAWSVSAHQHRAHGVDAAPAVPTTSASRPAHGSPPARSQLYADAAVPAASGPAPIDVSWLQVGLGVLPFSPTAGPGAVRGGVPAGFARTQPGAVLAAIQILGRLSWSATSTTTMSAVAAQMTTPAADALAALTYGPPTNPSLIPRLAGFQVLSYDGARAVINIALSFNSTLREVPATMAWVDGDWRLEGAPGPLSATSWAALNDLVGYVVFSGQTAGSSS